MPGVALAALALVSQACSLYTYTSPPSIGPARYVEVAGVIVSYRAGVEGSRGYVEIILDNGGSYRADSGAGPGFSIGDLLLAGSKPSAWHDIAVPMDPKSWPAGCYGYDQKGYDRDKTVELDNGLTLQKTADFTWPTAAVHKDNRIFGPTLCLNRQGQVFTIVG